MNIYTARKCIDLLLDMYEANNSNFINHNTKALILDFIGGEPLLEAKLIEEIVDYYIHEGSRRNIPFIPFTKISFATNGQNWFTPESQHLLNKYHDIISCTVSIDGIQELHDKYRIDKYGNGSFEKAWLAFLDCKNKYGLVNSKMTFTPGSIQYMFESVKMMINNECKIINCNFAYEPMYTINDGKNIYFELKKIADYLLLNKLDTYISILDRLIGNKHDIIHDNKNYCGGTGNMLAFSPDGKAYPCIRYMPISIGNEKANIAVATSSPMDDDDFDILPKVENASIIQPNYSSNTVVKANEESYNIYNDVPNLMENIKKDTIEKEEFVKDTIEISKDRVKEVSDKLNSYNIFDE